MSDFLLARVAIDYRSPLTQEDGQVEIEIRCTRVGTASVATYERMLSVRDGRLAAEAEAVLAHYDWDAGKSRPMSDRDRRPSCAAGSPESGVGGGQQGGAGLVPGEQRDEVGGRRDVLPGRVVVALDHELASSVVVAGPSRSRALCRQHQRRAQTTPSPSLKTTSPGSG